MVEEVFGVRDDGFSLLVVALAAIWRGATQALDRGQFSILLGVVVVRVDPVSQLSQEEIQVTTGKALFAESSKKWRVQERTRGIPCCGPTMGMAIFHPSLANM